MNNSGKKKLKNGHKITIDEGDTITKNLSRHIIIIDESKMHLALRDYDSDRINQTLIWTPIGILISFGLCIITTDKFQDKLGIPGATWLAFVLILMLLCVVWLVYLLIKIFKKSSNRISTPQQFIEKIKAETDGV